MKPPTTVRMTLEASRGAENLDIFHNAAILKNDGISRADANVLEPSEGTNSRWVDVCGAVENSETGHVCLRRVWRCCGRYIICSYNACQSGREDGEGSPWHDGSE